MAAKSAFPGLQGQYVGLIPLPLNQYFPTARAPGVAPAISSQIAGIKIFQPHFGSQA
jgi:hypothetical protein